MTDATQTTSYRVFVQGWTRQKLQELIANYSGFPLELDNYAETPEAEGYTTRLLSEARYYAVWLQTVIDNAANVSEEIKVILTPDPDTTEELETLERLEQAWYALVFQIEQAYKSGEKDTVAALFTESEHKREAWLDQALAFETFAEAQLELLRAAVPKKRTDEQEESGALYERYERYETDYRNMRRLWLQASHLVTRIPALKETAEEVTRTGDFPDYD